MAGLFDARAREAAASLALASLTGLPLLCLLFGEWWPWATDEPFDLAAMPATPGPFDTAGAPVTVAAVLPTVLVVLGAEDGGYALDLLAGVAGLALLALPQLRISSLLESRGVAARR